ncbi:MAG: sulfurtransferase TusA family protein [Thiomicrospira sp.]|uniref:sulfurtransferase TusA family protein n=1 Tax=Thiomicrospira sp. TaxID=935 RepID=UPI001A04A06A|nr:sulfurtransferase TusA family protein [Thiomicrospira sp.]MBE0493676.1 sulfurtransferase TusA family protein [Thiomicrospira sp.]
MNTHQLDAKGLKCPMPVIKLQQLVRQLPAGDQIEIACTDPAAEKDIQSWCKVNRHQFLSAQAEPDHQLIYIQIGDPKN